MKVINKEQLQDIIKNSDINTNLNYLDVSKITDMSNVFSKSNFNGDSRNVMYQML